MLSPEGLTAVAAYIGVALAGSTFFAEWIIRYSAAKTVEEKRRLVEEARSKTDALSAQQRQELEALIKKYK